MHDDNAEKGFTVLGFPCNQFGGQEPGTNEEILEFAQSKFDVTFPMFSKIEVNGDGACELYQLLTSAISNPEGKPDIAWNFTKFLIDGDGNVVKRFEPAASPAEIAGNLQDYLS